MNFNIILVSFCCYFYGICAIILGTKFSSDIDSCTALNSLDMSINFSIFTFLTTTCVSLASFGIPFLILERKEWWYLMIIILIILSTVLGIIHLLFIGDIIYKISNCSYKVKVYNLYLSTYAISFGMSTVFIILFIIIYALYKFIKDLVLKRFVRREVLHYTQFELNV